MATNIGIFAIMPTEDSHEGKNLAGSAQAAAQAAKDIQSRQIELEYAHYTMQIEACKQKQALET